MSSAKATIERGTPEWDAARKGEYYEEVRKLVDGVVEDIKAGKITRWHDAVGQLVTHVNKSVYATEVDQAIECLRYSDNACAGLRYWSPESLSCKKADPFPWLPLARKTIEYECEVDLQGREEFKSLLK